MSGNNIITDTPRIIYTTTLYKSSDEDTTLYQETPSTPIKSQDYWAMRVEALREKNKELEEKDMQWKRMNDKWKRDEEEWRRRNKFPEVREGRNHGTLSVCSSRRKLIHVMRKPMFSTFHRMTCSFHQFRNRSHDVCDKETVLTGRSEADTVN